MARRRSILAQIHAAQKQSPKKVSEPVVKPAVTPAPAPAPVPAPVVEVEELEVEEVGSIPTTSTRRKRSKKS